jgi:ribonuclease HI
MVMADRLTCQSCGREFELPGAVRKKYPNWTPKQCMDCRDMGRPAEAAKGNGNAGKGSGTERMLLTPEEVLARFDSGPKDGVFTDGSCSGNPGPGGWGAVYVRNNRVVEERSGTDPATTNNRMELRAMIEGLSMIPEGETTVVYTDSNLVVNTLTKWAAGWEKAGWRRKDGEVKNLELVKEAYALAKARPKVAIRWIKAHDGSRWNEYADALASAYMREQGEGSREQSAGA